MELRPVPSHPGHSPVLRHGPHSTASERNTSARAALGLSSPSGLSFQDGTGAPGEFAPLISDVTVTYSRVTGLTTNLLRWVCIRFLSCCNKVAKTVWPKTTELHCLAVLEAESQNSRRRRGRAPPGTCRGGRFCVSFCFWSRRLSNHLWLVQASRLSPPPPSHGISLLRPLSPKDTGHMGLTHPAAPSWSDPVCSLDVSRAVEQATHGASFGAALSEMTPSLETSAPWKEHPQCSSGS